MAFGNPGNQPDNDDDHVMSEINMTPLVDVMLVLLIIFIITMPVLTHAVKVALPQAVSAPQETRPTQVSVNVNVDGSYAWSGEVISFPALEARLQTAARQRPQPEIHIHADRNVIYDKVAQLLAATQRAGLQKVGFVTTPD